VIAAARPARLLLIADGPRADRAGEAERCKEVRKIITSVDWPCEVVTNFAAENMGCRRRVVSGLNWVFSQVEEAIILEDDCLPDTTFFRFCSELLDRYRDIHNVGMISGFNPLEKSFPFKYSYYYSVMPSIWGWATWKRAWQQYDEHMRTWPAVKDAGLLGLVFEDRKTTAYWSSVFDAMYQGTGPNTWDYQWFYTCWTLGFLNIIPSRNLIENIGFGAEATHTMWFDRDRSVPCGPIGFPLEHPPAITPWPAHSVETNERFYARSIYHKIRRRLSLK
jgi:hypothetical protein